MMIYPSIDKLLNKIGSKYLLVNIVARRAKEMAKTGHYQMKENEYICKKYWKSFRRSCEGFNYT